MRCSKARPLLDDLADGVLPADRSDQVRAHVDQCADCEQELALLRSVTPSLTAWGDLEPPPGCFDRILERIEALPPEMHVPTAQPAQPSLRFLRGGARWLVTSGAAAAAVLIAAIAIERAGDVDDVKPHRDRPARVTPAIADAAGLRPGEIALTRIAVTRDLEQRDGLRRRRNPENRELPPDLAVPVSLDSLGRDPLGRDPLGRDPLGVGTR